MGATAAIPAYPSPNRTERALDLLFPPLCVGCRRVGRWICERCWSKVDWLGARVDDPAPGSHLDRIVAVSIFDDVSREAVHALKYEGHHAIAGLLGKLMAGRIVELSVDIVGPVPLHPSRRRERGYDQAAMLARVIGRETGAPYRGDLLRRVRRTRQQATLDATARRENVRGAFQCRAAVEGKSLALVDDVYTTGATMEAAAEVVRSAGAAEVVGVVFARLR